MKTNPVAGAVSAGRMRPFTAGAWLCAMAVAGLGAATGSCGQPTTIALTVDAQFVLAKDRSIDQYSIVLSGPWGSFDALLSPANPGADLGATETLNIVVSDDLADQVVDIEVVGLQDGNFVASGNTSVMPLLHDVITAMVVLRVCEAVDGPFCEPSEDPGFCGGDVLVSCNLVTDETMRACCDPYGCNPDRLGCNVCTPSTTECNGNSVIECSADGLIDASTQCSPGVCLVDRCVACSPSTVECRPDAAPATSGTIVTCDMDGNITDSTTCPYGCGGKPVGCNECVAGTMHCLDVGGFDYLVDCATDGTITSMTACTYGCNATLGACNACTPDPTGLNPECQMDDLVTCDAAGGVAGTMACTPYGCNTTVDPDACNVCDPDPTIVTQCIGDLQVSCSTGGQIVNPVDCAAMSTTCNVATGSCNNCTPGASFCTGLGDIAMCDATGNPTITMTCTYGCSEPMPGMPACQACIPNETACQGSDLVACDASGGVVSTTPCAFGCSVEAGPTADRCNECNPGTTECQGSTLVVCTPDGYVATSTPCAYGCDSSPTAPAPDRCYDCTPGTDECQGSTYVTCSVTGTILTSTACGTLTNQCNTGTCTPTGCMAVPVANGTICNDSAYCSVGDVCTGGICGGSPRNCTDMNPCTFDACDEAGDICVSDPAPLIGTACDDGQFCTIPDACNAMGVCTGPLRVCDDMNPCTLDTCNVVMGACTADPVPLNGMACDDGFFCTAGTTCTSGTCGGGTGACTDGNACTTDTCNESTDTCSFPAVANGTACSDGMFCTISDTCQSGTCTGGGPRDCSDTLLCNTDSCDETNDICAHPCIGMTQFCSTPGNLVTCTGSGMNCGETNVPCTFGCNMGRDECNACDPADVNYCTAGSPSVAYTCGTVAPADGTITSMSTCAYACDAGANFCFFPDTCAAAYTVPVSTAGGFGPTTFADNMSNYAADVAGSCGAAGDDVIHSITIPTAAGTGLTIFSTILLDATASSGIDTASHITTTCGDSTDELIYASSPCGASSGSGLTCANTAGTDELLRACGMPSNAVLPGAPPYFTTLDSTASSGAFTFSLSVTPLTLDICTQSGNISNTPGGPYFASTTGKANDYEYDVISGVLGCPGPPSNSNACGDPNGDPTGGGGVCGSDGGDTGEDIVFYYRAGTTGFLTVDTQGSTYDTILYIKSGCNLNCLPPSDCLACNDDHNFSMGSWSRLYRRPVTAGSLYYIVVDGWGGAAGSVTLNVSFSTI